MGRGVRLRTSGGSESKIWLAWALAWAAHGTQETSEASRKEEKPAGNDACQTYRPRPDQKKILADSHNRASDQTCLLASCCQLQRQRRVWLQQRVSIVTTPVCSELTRHTASSLRRAGHPLSSSSLSHMFCCVFQSSIHHQHAALLLCCSTESASWPFAEQASIFSTQISSRHAISSTIDLCQRFHLLD